MNATGLGFGARLEDSAPFLLRRWILAYDAAYVALAEGLGALLMTRKASTQWEPAHGIAGDKHIREQQHQCGQGLNKRIAHANSGQHST
jgi:hypothetical protein